MLIASGIVLVVLIAALAAWIIHKIDSLDIGGIETW
jgi:hypothetical protein